MIKLTALVRSVTLNIDTMKILIACEYSGAVRDAFIKQGHDVMSCDLLPTDFLFSSVKSVYLFFTSSSRKKTFKRFVY